MGSHTEQPTRFSDKFERPTSSFPRTQWLERVCLPPFHRSEPACEVGWAAKQASRCWARCLGQNVGNMHHFSRPPLLDVVDAVCFRLAVLDKILEG